MTPTEQSNYLPELAARIRGFHEATAEGLKRSVENGIAAGELLIEAKDQLKHGQWLPWLRDNCSISERTAQLYMRLAKNRTAIEAKSATVADLNMNEAAALLVLSSDARKLFEFVKQADNLSGEELINFCIEENVAVINSENYNPLAGRSDAETLEWHLFMLFLSCDAEAGRAGLNPQDAASHVEYLLQRPFQNVDEWLGAEGDKWRALYGRPISAEFVPAWAAFRRANLNLTLADLRAKLDTLEERFDRDRRAGSLKQAVRKKGRAA